MDFPPIVHRCPEGTETRTLRNSKDIVQPGAGSWAQHLSFPQSFLCFWEVLGPGLQPWRLLGCRHRGNSKVPSCTGTDVHKDLEKKVFVLFLV